MLIHITPTIFIGSYDKPLECELLDLTVKELGLTLVGGKDLATRRPFPNKHFLVGCRKVRKTAMNGILIESREALSSYDVVTRWEVFSSFVRRFVLTHHCTYNVIDTEFEAVSDAMHLWSATAGEPLGDWASRRPKGMKWVPSVPWQPKMDIWSASHGGIERQGDVHDLVKNGRVLERVETFQVPTIEPERLLSYRGWSQRIPGMELAFKESDNYGRKR